MIRVSHLLKWIEELVVEECRVHLGELLREEPRVEGDKREVPRKEARHPPLDCLVGTMGNLTTLRIIADERLESAYGVKVERLPYDLEVKTPTGNQFLLANEMYRNCDICVGERKLVVDLISLAIKGYDVIIGMDWLARYDARVDCRTKMVEFCIPGEMTLKLVARGILASSALVSGIRVRKLLSNGVRGYLGFLVSTPGEKVSIEDMPVINEYPDVFPNELVSMPPEREIEFKIDLAPGTTLISKAPYRMVPAELK
ncbi:uncharacterized protein LOC113759735 [Coffea eugenioides]|uniref:uncharacterized protein LOC113759735 n=1 Tax=Coffea eugenioides TaxID=49369 RepID=UPI000F6089A3|nr:uncharacterized protein LOC113759735 [Coffea eugenioides]